MREITAPSGYALDATVHEASAAPGDTATLAVSDVPQNDPITMIVLKVDAETGLASGLGRGTLGGAEYTVRYYAGYYDSISALPANPTREWVFATNENGQAAYTDRFKASGPDLYYATNGQATLPLGTVTIQETKAPEGYLLTDSSISLQQILTDGSTLEPVHTFVEPDDTNPTTREEVRRGDLSFVKVDDSMGALAGVPFLVTSDTTSEWHVVVTDGNGALIVVYMTHMHLIPSDRPHRDERSDIRHHGAQFHSDKSQAESAIHPLHAHQIYVTMDQM